MIRYREPTGIALWFLCLVLFIGPSGKFFFPVEIGSLKLFMLFSIAALFFLLHQGLNKQKFFYVSGILFVYALFIFMSLLANPSASAAESLRSNSFVRSLIHLGVFFGFCLMAISLYSLRPSEKFKIIRWAINGYVVVTILGLVLYIATVVGIVPRSVYVKFVTLDQQAYGFVRFSPGTYANEWGILASFFSGLLIIVAAKAIENKRLEVVNPKLVVVLIILSMLGLVLATTRTAFGAFFLSIPLIMYYAKSPKLIAWGGSLPYRSSVSFGGWLGIS